MTAIAHKNVRLSQNRIFLQLLTILLFSALGSLMGGIGHNHLIMGVDDFFSRESVMFVSTFIYMIFHVAIPVCFYLYVRTVLDIDLTRISDVLITFAPLALAYTVLALTPINQGIFYFEKGMYHRGEYMWVFYLVAVWYTVVSVNNIILYRNNIRMSVLLSFFSFVILALAGVIMQFLNPHMKVESFFNAVVLIPVERYYVSQMAEIRDHSMDIRRYMWKVAY